MAKDLRTDYQKQRAKREEAVCKMYADLKAGNTQGSDSAIMEHIAAEISKKYKPISPMGVRYLITHKYKHETGSQPQG